MIARGLPTTTRLFRTTSNSRKCPYFIFYKMQLKNFRIGPVRFLKAPKSLTRR